MKYLLLSFILVFSTGVNISVASGSASFHVQIFCDDNQRSIPLSILSHKTIRLPEKPTNGFRKDDGIFCSADGKYLEGLSRFKDCDGDSWELKFSSEKLSNKKYSVTSVIIIKGQEVVQQNDFTFKGSPEDILKSEVAPFSVIGLRTKTNQWFSISLAVK